VRRTLLVFAFVLAPLRGGAQRVVLEPHDPAFWLGAGLLFAGAATVDERIGGYSNRHRSGLLDTFADAGNLLGQGRTAMIGLGAAYVGLRIAGKRDHARKVEYALLGYAAGNLVVSALKLATGRHRPDSTGEPWRFRPFHSGNDWYSLPSAHAAHAFSLAAALAAQTDHRWLMVAGYSMATLVAWSRVYDRAHWPSDVVLGATVGVASGLTVVHWLERR
jgi:membrane-associated phospholipid phosphatase